MIKKKKATKKKMKYVLVRTYAAGVWIGFLKSEKDTEVVMCEARNIWYWDGAASLSQIAEQGVKNQKGSKITVPVSEIKLKRVESIYNVTEAARNNLAGVLSWVR